jgi:hypothetical protein
MNISKVTTLTCSNEEVVPELASEPESLPFVTCGPGSTGLSLLATLSPSPSTVLAFCSSGIWTVDGSSLEGCSSKNGKSVIGYSYQGFVQLGSDGGLYLQHELWSVTCCELWLVTCRNSRNG